MTASIERSPERDAALEAMLGHVSFDGWTNRALAHGLADAGMAADEALLLFPDGRADMIEAWCDLADRRMAEAAPDFTGMGVAKRVRALLALRFAQNRPHREAVRRALGWLGLPGNSAIAARITARTVDAIWHAAGDRAADMSWYTKRASLAAIYASAVLFWLRDDSEEAAATMAFIDRRLAGIARIGKLRARFRRAA
ncbi:MAG: COQ9 family protein [Rhodospirillales bacterium]|nr:COQ9 family protein [Rhodospirillales bacterium]